MSQLNTKFLTEDDRLIVSRSQDCTPIAEHAKALHNEGIHGSAEMKHAARIPLVIVEDYCNKNNITFRDFMGDSAHIKRVVMNPDNAMFRVWKGAL